MAAPQITPLGWLVLGVIGLFFWKALKSGGGVRSKVQAKGPVAVVGDSLAVGLAGPLKGELTGLGEVTGWGVGGSIAAMWTMQIDAVLDGKPGTVIVSLGTNDVVSDDARAKFPERIKIIADKIRAAGALAVLLESPSQLANMNEIKAALASTGAFVLPAPSMEMSPDKVHPTDKGYAAWAKVIAAVLT